MKNLTEFIYLLKDLIDHLNQHKEEIPFGDLSKLQSDLNRELDKAIQINSQNMDEYKYEYFVEEILHSKSPNGEMYEYIGGRNWEIKKIQNLISELITPEIQSKHKSRKNEFERLRSNANFSLLEIGFLLNKEDKFTSEFRKDNGLKIRIVDQRYDPPECWISEKDNQQFTRIGFISEYFFDKNLKLIRKYNDSGSGFDFGSMNYYLEFIREYENQLLEMDNFVSEINQWSKNNYLKIEEIKNAI